MYFSSVEFKSGAWCGLTFDLVYLQELDLVAPADLIVDRLVVRRDDEVLLLA